MVAVSLENRNTGADIDLLFAIRRYPFSDLNSIDESYKWTIRNAKFASKANNTAGLTVNPGDALAVYVNDAGGDIADVCLTLDFIVTNASNIALQFNASGFFDSSDFPAINLIPEILT